MKKPVVFITIADAKNLPMAKDLKNSFLKFHPDIPFEIVQGEDLASYLADDKEFYYRATPILGEKYLKEYELVVKIDADSLVLGDLSYIWETKDYDVGCVLNYNRYDIQHYPVVQGWGILPIEYVNCGLVAMRNEQLVHNWKVWCFTPQFDRLQYKEQDGLNVQVYHGNWNCRIFDHGDGPANMHAWWGMFGKFEWQRSEMRGDKVFVPKGLGDTPFPHRDIEIKIAHMGGGNQKLNWGVLFPTEVMTRINYLISEEHGK